MGLVALVIGIYTKWLIFYVGSFGWVGLGTSLGLPLLFSMFWRKTTKAAAVAGMIAGFASTYIWGLTPSLKKVVHEGGTATIFTVIVIVVVSLLTSTPDRRKQANEMIAMTKE